MSSQHRFRLDRKNGKVMGVCAGIAAQFDVDVTLVRVAVALTIAMTFPAGLVAYLVLALVADCEGKQRLRERGQARAIESRPAEVRQRLSDLDARMQRMEREIVDSRSHALAREIDALR